MKLQRNIQRHNACNLVSETNYQTLTQAIKSKNNPNVEKKNCNNLAVRIRLNRVTSNLLHQRLNLYV